MPNETATPPAPTAETAPTVQTVTPADLLGSLNMPTPSERAIAAEAADRNAPAPVNPGDLDSAGRPFDPAKFKPAKDTAGRWIRRGPGRPPNIRPPAEKSFVPGDAPPPTPQTPAPAAIYSPPMPDKYDLAAEAYCRTGYVILDAVFQGNGEWQPESEAEHEGLKKSLSTYLRHVGAVDLPPWATFALAAGTYALGRIQKPNTKRRAAELFAGARGMFGGKSAAPKPGDPAPLNYTPPAVQPPPAAPIQAPPAATPAAVATITPTPTAAAA